MQLAKFQLLPSNSVRATSFLWSDFSVSSIKNGINTVSTSVPIKNMLLLNYNSRCTHLFQLDHKRIHFGWVLRRQRALDQRGSFEQRPWLQSSRMSLSLWGELLFAVASFSLSPLSSFSPAPPAAASQQPQHYDSPQTIAKKTNISFSNYSKISK